MSEEEKPRPKIGIHLGPGGITIRSDGAVVPAEDVRRITDLSLEDQVVIPGPDSADKEIRVVKKSPDRPKQQ